MAINDDHVEDPMRNVTLPPNQDPASIYYIHPSDANSVQLVSFKFNGEGFTGWKKSMLLALSAKNKLGFFDGSICKPDAGTVECRSWERCNNLVCSLILGNLSEIIAKSVMFLKSAREVWCNLEERFGLASMAQVYSLEQKLVELIQGEKFLSFSLKSSQSGMQLKKLTLCLTVPVTIAPAMSLRSFFKDSKKKW
ncbi:uncharacterized protein [Spinacia oleracea]|uniref:Retrotransposon Copia-like N-terminal domain-containing protein n=1 Tax=Spinacia oleracea TaxID=3562 RepID=A0A9R0HU43_SPIOL|nr:uncharacterized protein LOC110776800 [Spinacia oleracea]